MVSTDELLKDILADFAVACVVGTYLIVLMILFVDTTAGIEFGLIVVGWSLAFLTSILVEDGIRR